MNQRVLKLMERLALDQCEAVLVHNPSNMFYLSGYTGEGLVLIGREMQTIITDFRYTEQAEKQAPGFSVEMTEKGVSHEAIVGRLCAEHEIGALYYEDDYLTVRSFESCRKAVPGVEWKSLHEEVQHIRQIKDEDELSRIAEACRITSEAFERLLPEIKEGVTEKELALKLEFDMLTHGATGLAFSTIVAAGANGSLPHAVPGDYKVRLGDMITFDFGAKYNGYCADMTRTVALGQPSDEMRKVVVSNAGGRTVMLSDVAEIRDTLEKATMDERANGQRSVRVMIQKQSRLRRPFRSRAGPLRGHRHPRRTPPEHDLQRHSGRKPDHDRGTRHLSARCGRRAHRGLRHRQEGRLHPPDQPHQRTHYPVIRPQGVSSTNSTPYKKRRNDQ